MERFSTIVRTVRENSSVWFSRISIIIILTFIFFIAGGGISHNSKWRVEQIEIKGAKSVSVDVMRSLIRQQIAGNYYFVYARDNSHLLPRKEIVQMLLETFPRLASVVVERTDDHTLVFTVSERNPYALWCGAEKSLVQDEEKVCWFIDAHGFVFDHAPLFSEGVYMEIYGTLTEQNINEPLRGTLPQKRFDSATRVMTQMQEDIGKPAILEMKAENELTARVYTSKKYPFLSGVLIRFKDESVAEDLVKNLKSAIAVQFPANTALEKRLLYIDMRFGNKVIFGFEN